MNLPLPVLSWLAAACLSVGVVLLVVSVVAEGGVLFVVLGSHIHVFNGALRFLRVRPIAQHIVAVQLLVLLSLLAVAYAMHVWPLALGFGAFVSVAPWLFVQAMRKQRLKKLESQLDGFLVVLANALRATPSIADSLEMSARLLPAPLGEELDLMLKEHRLGASLDQALAAMGMRVRSRALNTAIGTLRAARRTGGDVPATLTISAQTLREMSRLDAVLAAQTAGPRMQLNLIVGMPFLIIGGMNASNPGYFNCLFDTPRGLLVGGIAVALWIAALVVGRIIMASSVK